MTDQGPHVPTKWEPAHASAFQALARGEAEPHQQQMALDWLLEVTGLRDLSYRPGDATATAFAEGKRFVGLQVGKMLDINPREFTQQKD
ncbi:hypothetical protein GG804_25010 [Sphingomonas histidinilytica]|uniref:Bbp19 family protein n=1 Tax=Rhizorhabdus histidinilytica TaxID=439228 RepID=UPI001ADD60C2|nr:hypothetical protein [Rhizorhabdus histidinilytica]MBO9380032.1 hypothetical protein [Rhizorhabdus histidinilytica]